MQSQMIGMQSSLDRILSAIQSQSQSNIQQPGYSTNMGQGSAREGGPSYPPRTRYVRCSQPAIVQLIFIFKLSFTPRLCTSGMFLLLFKSPTFNCVCSHTSTLHTELSQVLRHLQKMNPRRHWHSHALHSVPLSRLFKDWPMQLQRQLQRPLSLLPCESYFNRILSTSIYKLGWL